MVNKVDKTLTFYTWYPGCPMEEDAYGIPKPKDTEIVVPTLIFVPCVGYGPGGFRLGYGGGFYDRTLASLQPKPFTVGLGYDFAYLPHLQPEAHDVPLDAILARHRRHVAREVRPPRSPASRGPLPPEGADPPWGGPAADRCSGMLGVRVHFGDALLAPHQVEPAADDDGRAPPGV